MTHPSFLKNTRRHPAREARGEAEGPPVEAAKDPVRSHVLSPTRFFAHFVWLRMTILVLVAFILSAPSALAGGAATVTLKPGSNINGVSITCSNRNVCSKSGSTYTVVPGVTYTVQVTREYTNEEWAFKTGYGSPIFNKNTGVQALAYVEPKDRVQTFTLTNIEASENYTIDLSSSGNKDLAINASSDSGLSIGTGVMFGAKTFPVSLTPVTVTSKTTNTVTSGSSTGAAASSTGVSVSGPDSTGAAVETSGGNPGEADATTTALKPDNNQANLGICIPTLSGAKCTVDNYQDYLKTLFLGAQIVASVLAVVMIVYGGIQYIISQGDTGKTGEAKEIIIGALTGIALLILSNLFLQFLFTKVAT